MPSSLLASPRLSQGDRACEVSDPTVGKIMAKPDESYRSALIGHRIGRSVNSVSRPPPRRGCVIAGLFFFASERTRSRRGYSLVFDDRPSDGSYDSAT
jgi:hypothetical protein